MILIADGFMHYGSDGATSQENMLDGVFAEVNNCECRTTRPRTGTHALGRSTSTFTTFFRRVLPGPRSVLGWGGAMYLQRLPDENNGISIVEWRNGANQSMCKVHIQSTGDIALVDSTNSLLGQTSSPAIVAEAYQHIEVKCTFAGAAGACEVRVNGVTVLDLTNVNIGGAATAAQYRWGVANSQSPEVGELWLDDHYIWDDQGSFNTDFVGDIKLFRIDPNADTAQTDWTRNAGSNDFEAIDDDAPDDATTYLQATSPAQESEFQLENTPATADSILFLATYVYGLKTDAGNASVRVGMASANIGSPSAPATVYGTEHTITEAWTYYEDIFESDPATGSAWTPDAVDDSRILLNRVT